jgi:hypothetical protein
MHMNSNLNLIRTAQDVLICAKLVRSEAKEINIRRPGMSLSMNESHFRRTGRGIISCSKDNPHNGTGRLRQRERTVTEAAAEVQNFISTLLVGSPWKEEGKTAPLLRRRFCVLCLIRSPADGARTLKGTRLFCCPNLVLGICHEGEMV